MYVCFYVHVSVESSLERANVKGMKRLHNFIKKEEERIAW